MLPKILFMAISDHSIRVADGLLQYLHDCSIRIAYVPNLTALTECLTALDLLYYIHLFSVI